MFTPEQIAAQHRAFDALHDYIRTPAGRREIDRIRAQRDGQPPITSSKTLIARACVAGDLHVAEAIELVRRLR